MSLDKLPQSSDSEKEVKDVLAHGIQNCSLTDAMPIERNQTFSLSHKHPELQAVLNQTEIQNVNYTDLSEEGFDDSFMEARNTLVEHFTAKLSTLPPDVREDFLKSLDLQTTYKPNFPLHAQIHKSSFA
ncbi:MAG: hypothetical protein IT343_02970 [Candidatus Melainabacteria bacterium]|jgi:hypothetical protein|nr:hypothetical protein [Candidatus Melainabacteria bacterium]